MTNYVKLKQVIISLVLIQEKYRHDYSVKDIEFFDIIMINVMTEHVPEREGEGGEGIVNTMRTTKHEKLFLLF